MRNVQYVRKVDGEVEDKEKLLKWFGKFLDKMPDGEVLIEFTSTSRTDAQNKYYWVVCGIIGRTLGMHPEDVHKYFKECFLPKEEYFVVIKEKQLRSTTEQTKEQMAVYLDKVIHFAAEQGIVIPDLEEYKHRNNN